MSYSERDLHRRADDLRAKAQVLRELEEPIRGVDVWGEIIADIPNGPGHILRVVWRPPRGNAPPNLGIRIWKDCGSDQAIPLPGKGIDVPHYRLAALADALAVALERGIEHSRTFRREPGIGGR